MTGTARGAETLFWTEESWVYDGTDNLAGLMEEPIQNPCAIVDQPPSGYSGPDGPEILELRSSGSSAGRAMAVDKKWVVSRVQYMGLSIPYRLDLGV